MAKLLYKACFVCASKSGKRCGGCNCIFYCSRACQEKDWPEHKTVCSLYRDDTSFEKKKKRSDMALQKYREEFPKGWLKLVVQLHALTDEQRMGSVVLLRSEDPDAILKLVKRSEVIESMPAAFKMPVVANKPECCYLGIIDGLPEGGSVKVKVWCALKVDRTKHKRAVSIMKQSQNSL